MTPQSSGTMTGGDSGPEVETVPPRTLLPAGSATFKSRLRRGCRWTVPGSLGVFTVKAWLHLTFHVGVAFMSCNVPHPTNFPASLSKSQRLLTVILSSWLE